MTRVPDRSMGNAEEPGDQLFELVADHIVMR